MRGVGTMRRRVGTSAVLAAVCASVLVVSAGPADAAIVDGRRCPRVGRIASVVRTNRVTQRQFLVRLRCTRVGNVRVWKRISRVPITPIPTTTTTVPAGIESCTDPRFLATNLFPSDFVGCSAPGGYSPLLVPGGTTVASGQAAAALLSAPGGFNASGGALRFNRPTSLATDGTRLALADRNNNRVLIWSTAPTAASTAPDLVLGQANFTTNASGAGSGALNWPSQVSMSAGGVIAVADTNNDRVLIWRSVPSGPGQPADVVLDTGSDSAPWGVWTDGTRLVVARTGKGDLRVWTTLPTASDSPSAFTLSPASMGAPRQITSDGVRLIVGDDAATGTVAKTGSHVWTAFPTSAASAPATFLAYGDTEHGWHNGHLDASGLYLLQKDLDIWASVPESNTAPSLTVSPLPVRFGSAGGGDVARVGARLYVLENYGNRLAVYDTPPNSPGSLPSFYVGSAAPGDNTLRSRFILTDPLLASDGVSLAAASGFDARIAVWRQIPATDAARPDLYWMTPFRATDVAGGVLRGFRTFAVVGESRLAVWTSGIPLTLGALPTVQLGPTIGGVSMTGLAGVAVDALHLSLADRATARVYVFDRVPDATTAPRLTLPGCADARGLHSDGIHLVLTCGTAPHVRAWTVGALAEGQAPQAAAAGVALSDARAALPSAGGLFVADTGASRVLWWSSLQASVAGVAPSAIVGAGSSTSDTRPGLSSTELSRPASLVLVNGHLFVGERTTSNRIVRYTLR